MVTDVVLKSKALQRKTDLIRGYENKTQENLRKIAVTLKEIQEKKLYEEDGFTGVGAYAEKVLGYRKSTTSNLVAVARKFLDESGNLNQKMLEGGATNDKYSVYQLSELKPLDVDEVVSAMKEGDINPDMSQKELREYTKSKLPEPEHKAEKKTAQKTETSPEDDIIKGSEYQEIVPDAKSEEFIKVDRVYFSDLIDQLSEAYQALCNPTSDAATIQSAVNRIGIFVGLAKEF